MPRIYRVPGISWLYLLTAALFSTSLAYTIQTSGTCTSISSSECQALALAAGQVFNDGLVNSQNPLGCFKHTGNNPNNWYFNSATTGQDCTVLKECYCGVPAPTPVPTPSSLSSTLKMNGASGGIVFDYQATPSLLLYQRFPDRLRLTGTLEADDFLLSGRADGSFQSALLRLAEVEAPRAMNDIFASGRTCQEIWDKGEHHGAGTYYVNPTGLDIFQVKCDANGKTILVDYDSGYVNGYKLTNQRMWALMRASEKMTRSIFYSGSWHSSDHTLYGEWTSTDTSRMTVFFAKSWNGHTTGSEPVLDDSSSTIILGEFEYGRGNNYWRINTSTYNLPSTLASACSCSNGAFSRFQYLLSG